MVPMWGQIHRLRCLDNPRFYNYIKFAFQINSSQGVPNTEQMLGKKLLTCMEENHSQEGGPLVPGCGSCGFASELSSYLCQGWIRGRQASKHSSQLQSNPQIHVLDWLLAWEEEGRRHLQGESRIMWGQPWAPALELWPQEQAGQLASVSIWIKMLVLFCLPGLTLPASRAVHSSVWRDD